MQTLKHEIRFLTPAFLGNAEQSGQWRTPPFKALLRHWWRVVWAAKHGYPQEISDMRRHEATLFGNAWLAEQFRKSAVRIRLSHWNVGEARNWNRLEQAAVHHPEVQQTRNKVGPHAYLAYGPLDGRGGTKFGEKVNAAIQAGEAATLSVAVPDVDAADIRYALALIDAYGGAGGRSRNGWGSLSLTPANGSPAHEPDLAFWSRPWHEALALDWPHAIGRDDTGALAWRTAKVYDDWKTLMRDLAIIKIGLRTMFVFPRNVRPPHERPVERHWLSYPVTSHDVRNWRRSGARLPNSLRLKVRPDAQDTHKLRGIIFHVPCLPPPEFRPQRTAIKDIWTRSHELLDELCHQPRLRTYKMILDTTRRDALRQQLDTITVERIPQ